MLPPHNCGAFRRLQSWTGNEAVVVGSTLQTTVTYKGPSTCNYSKASLSCTAFTLPKQPVTYRDASLSEPGGRLITPIYEFSDTFMFVHVFKGCLSLYALFRVSKQTKTAFLFTCSSVKHHSDEENEWHAAGMNPKATLPPTPHPTPKDSS